MFVMSHTATSRTMAAQTAVAAPSLRQALADLWRAFTRDFSGSYRPERHYMRGPGPKWHAKYDPPPMVNESELGLRGTLKAA
jgi:hypothetical protein